LFVCQNSAVSGLLCYVQMAILSKKRHITVSNGYIRDDDRTDRAIPVVFFYFSFVLAYQIRGSAFGFVTLTSSPLGSMTKSPCFRA